MLESTIQTLVDAFLKENFSHNKKGTANGEDYYEQELFANYDDTIGDKTVIEILGKDDPYDAFHDSLEECFEESRWAEEDALFERVKEECFHGSLTEEDEETVKEYLSEHVSFIPPANHYLKQTFKVTLMMDTGDGNYDYVLNSIYPCWYGRDEHVIDKKASLLWLAKSQGYTKGQFQNAMKNGDMANPNGFLDSCCVELANLPSHMSTVTFLVEMTLDQLLGLNWLIKLQDRNGHFYDTTKNPYCGYVVLDKKTTTGLYDPWNGGGSLFGIQLEKDVKIPVKFIRSALPDGGDGYSVSYTYDMWGGCWMDTIKELHAPTKEAK